MVVFSDHTPVLNRGAAKEGTDLLDIIRLTFDPIAGPVALAQLASAGPQLKQDAWRHAALWFGDRIDRSLNLVRAVPEGRDTQGGDLLLVGELLQSALA